MQLLLFTSANFCYIDRNAHNNQNAFYISVAKEVINKPNADGAIPVPCAFIVLLPQGACPHLFSTASASPQRAQIKLLRPMAGLSDLAKCASHMANINSSIAPALFTDWLTGWLGSWLAGWIAAWLQTFFMRFPWTFRGRFMYLMDFAQLSFSLSAPLFDAGPFFLAITRTSALQLVKPGSHYVHWQSFVTPAFITGFASILIISPFQTQANTCVGFYCQLCICDGARASINSSMLFTIPLKRGFLYFQVNKAITNLFAFPWLL